MYHTITKEDEMDWDQEIENDRLKGMIIVYQEHIDVLEKETKELKDKIVFLETQLEYKSYGPPTYEEVSAS